MNYEDFWNSISASVDDKAKGEYYLRERGLEEHVKVVEYLKSFRSGSDSRVTYCQVATTLRYDKRIRRCLFKYIGVIEERIRAHLLDSHREKHDSIIQSAALKEKLAKKNGDFYNALTHLLFSDLVALFVQQSDSIKSNVFSGALNLGKNLRALVTLRNQVCHNKFLLGNLELKECILFGQRSSSLYANVNNLYFLSDDGCKNAFADEFDNCSLGKTTKYGNQVDWDLPKDVVIVINRDGVLLKGSSLSNK